MSPSSRRPLHPEYATAVTLPLMGEPWAVKLTVPEGTTGVTAVAAIEAVKVTAWFTLDETGDEEAMLNVAASGFTVCVSVAGVLTVKLASPE